MSLILILGLASVCWTAFELGRMSKSTAGVQAWDEHGRPLRIEVVD